MPSGPGDLDDFMALIALITSSSEIILSVHISSTCTILGGVKKGARDSS